MTDPNYTAMLLVLDRSGSMMNIRDDMVAGLQSMLAEQAAKPGMLTVDLVTFDTQIELVTSGADAASVRIEIEPRGGTALYDAIGVAVGGFGSMLAGLPEHARPGIVQVIVVTDGMENASQEYTAAAIKVLVTQQTEKYNWDFVFLGANQDAVLTGTTLGFDSGSSMTYDAAGENVQAMSTGLSRYLGSVRVQQREAFTDEERRDAVGPDA